MVLGAMHQVYFCRFIKPNIQGKLSVIPKIVACPTLQPQKINPKRYPCTITQDDGESVEFQLVTLEKITEYDFSVPHHS